MGGKPAEDVFGEGSESAPIDEKDIARLHLEEEAGVFDALGDDGLPGVEGVIGEKSEQVPGDAGGPDNDDAPARSIADHGEKVLKHAGDRINRDSVYRSWGGEDDVFCPVSTAFPIYVLLAIGRFIREGEA